ncbi:MULTISPECIES: Maf family protein [Sphingobium]|uniref:Maf family protein n=1 Tax=Sphingobium TaxID=165695 RepID=UPI0015EC952D|nr:MULTISPECIES: nucleoside triphosphate pyrophosphatase [Sphingobium]MCW2363484.1 septum formation protein [Sphingobium sp. B10D3B]MCW2403117.1 septum formation protein [Sphingobium sp. B10D7B]MCW2410096.1 septum formation protein [Sphingobium xanthum]
MTTPPLLLASQSESRRRLLADAAVPFETVPAGVDEDAIKASLVGEGLNARDLADALAEWKCRRPSMRHPDAFVLGCDQTLELDDGSLIDKVETREAAADLLARMSGRAHKLHSAAVIAQAGQAQWRQIESVTLQMRPLSAAFIDHYLDLDWEQCRWCVGCYRIEGPGAQLFSRISGSLFAVQGLPLLPLLDYLRVRSILPA